METRKTSQSQPRKANRKQPQKGNRNQPRQDHQKEQQKNPIPPRLLPWPSEDGKPCYLLPDADGGYLSRLADDMEAEQLETGAEVLEEARKLVEDPTSPYTEVRYAGIRLAECLSDALRVAESRGMRLAAPEPEPDIPESTEPGGASAGGTRPSRLSRPSPGGA